MFDAEHHHVQLLCSCKGRTEDDRCLPYVPPAYEQDGEQTPQRDFDISDYEYLMACAYALMRGGTQ